MFIFMGMKKLSVVILHYKAEGFLQLCLDSVLRATEGLDAEVIVADNASPGFDVSHWERIFPRVRWMAFAENYGFSKGNNLAVREAEGEFVALVNPDVVLPEDIFLVLPERVKNFENPGITGIRLIDGRGCFLPESKRRVPGLIASFSKLMGFYRYLKFYPFNAYYDERLREEDTGPTDILVGAFMWFRRDDFLRLGGFDERYFMYGEDIDLSKTFLDAGFRNYYTGALTALHFKGESTPRTDEYRKFFVDSSRLYYEKYAPFYARLVSPLIEWAFLHRRMFDPEIPESVSGIFLPRGDKEVASRLSRALQEEVKMPGSTDEIPDASMVVFDTSKWAYKEIIHFMLTNRHRNQRYRFYLAGANLLLGSDNPFSQGKVMRV